jgi:PIN like domain
MRKTFPGYYRPSQSEFRKLWDKCIFVLDANVLLNVYRYSEETRNELLDILRKIESRLWVPHQAALEYQRNRLEVISAQREAYQQIEHLLEDTHKKLDTQLKGYKRHPLIDTGRILKAINAVFEEQAEELKKVKEKHPDLLQDDDVRESLTRLVDGRVGQPYPEERLKQIFKEGEDRYAKSKPPGYKDLKSKDGERVFGDLVLWFQVIDKAASDHLPIIIVTDDVKEDWWWRHEGKIVGPNPELVAEIRDKAKVDFYMYVSDQFMEYARDYLKQQVDQGAIDEIREVRKLDEQRRANYERMFVEVEERTHAFHQELAMLDVEIGRVSSEIASLSEHFDEIVATTPDVGQSSEIESLLAEQVTKIDAMETRRRMLEERRQKLSHRLAFHLEQRNTLVHRDIGREHLIRAHDGSLRRTWPPRSHATDLPSPQPSIKRGGTHPPAEQGSIRKKPD